MAAYTLAERGRRVLVLERGPAADPESDPSDGPKMYLGMYGSGRGEVTDRRLRLREAYVVGGATTLGHAVKLAAPTSGGLDWAAASGLDAERFVVSLIQARDLAGVVRSDDRGAQLDPLALGLEKLELEGTYAACEQWEMLTPLLARAQARFPGLVEVLANCLVERIEHEKDVAVAVHGQHASGLAVRIPTTLVVVSAGALGSSELLRRSGLGGSEVGTNVWPRLSCDVTGEFREVVSAVATHARGLRLGGASFARYALVLESGIYPPAMQAVALPGWQEDRFEHMGNYRRMSRVAAVVSSTRPALLTWGRHGPRLDGYPSDPDEQQLRRGVVLAARALLAAGATRVLPDSPSWDEYCDDEALTTLEDRAQSGLRVTARDLCGGNAIGTVVDPDLRVRDVANVYVLDASVLRGAPGIDLQAAAMGIARYGAAAIPDAP